MLRALMQPMRGSPSWRTALARSARERSLPRTGRRSARDSSIAGAAGKPACESDSTPAPPRISGRPATGTSPDSLVSPSTSWTRFRGHSTPSVSAPRPGHSGRASARRSASDGFCSGASPSRSRTSSRRRTSSCSPWHTSDAGRDTGSAGWRGTGDPQPLRRLLHQGFAGLCSCSLGLSAFAMSVPPASYLHTHWRRHDADHRREGQDGLRLRPDVD